MEKIEGEYAQKIVTQTKLSESETNSEPDPRNYPGASESEDPGEIPCHPQ